MKKIDTINKMLQQELIERKKSFFTLAQANKILFEKGILSKNELSNGYLKNKLEQGEIPQSFKTTRKPRQWRILKDLHFKKPMSPENKVKKAVTKQGKIKTKKKTLSIITTERTHRENEKPLYFLCPTCGVNLSVPEEHRGEFNLCCYHCKNTFRNPLIQHIIIKKDVPYNSNNSQKKTTDLGQKKTTAQDKINVGCFLIFIIVFLIVIFAAIFDDDPRSDTEIYIDQQKEIYRREKENAATEAAFEALKQKARNEVDNEK